MKIAVLGGGAMGALYGGYLSQKNDVTIVDVNTALIEKVKAGRPENRGAGRQQRGLSSGRSRATRRACSPSIW